MIPYIAVDLDGTLAHYDGWKDSLHIGEPIAPMVDKVKKWLEEGTKVKIMTARITPVNGHPFDKEATVKAIEIWCETHIGQKLEVTNQKDYYMLQLWDDRCVQVISNEGISIAEKYFQQFLPLERRTELPKPQQK